MAWPWWRRQRVNHMICVRNRPGSTAVLVSRELSVERTHFLVQGKGIPSFPKLCSSSVNQLDHSLSTVRTLCKSIQTNGKRAKVKNGNFSLWWPESSIQNQFAAESVEKKQNSLENLTVFTNSDHGEAWTGLNLFAAWVSRSPSSSSTPSTTDQNAHRMQIGSLSLTVQRETLKQTEKILSILHD